MQTHLELITISKIKTAYNSKLTGEVNYNRHK